MAGMHQQLTCDMVAVGSVKVHDFGFVVEIAWPNLAAVFLWVEQLPVADPIQQQSFVHSIRRHLHH